MTGTDYWVYIAEMKDGRLYVGTTNEVTRREAEHRQGKIGTRTTRVFGFRGIRYTERHPDRASALKRERQLKRWNHAKKQALIEGEMAILKQLSKSRTRRTLN